MGKLRILNQRGDATVAWEATEEAAVREAERIFEEQRRRGATAFRADPNSEPVRIERFEPEAEQILIVPRIAGGTPR